MSEKLNVVKNFISMRYFKKFKTRDKLEKYQNKMLLKQMKYIKENSEYFKNIKADSIENFKDLPLMDKKVMMENFNKLNCVGIDRDKALEIAINGEKSRNFDEKLNNISVGLSSGTWTHPPWRWPSAASASPRPPSPPSGSAACPGRASPPRSSPASASPRSSSRGTIPGPAP